MQLKSDWLILFSGLGCFGVVLVISVGMLEFSEDIHGLPISDSKGLKTFKDGILILCFVNTTKSVYVDVRPIRVINRQ